MFSGLQSDYNDSVNEIIVLAAEQLDRKSQVHRIEAVANQT